MPALPHNLHIVSLWSTRSRRILNRVQRENAKQSNDIEIVSICVESPEVVKNQDIVTGAVQTMRSIQNQGNTGDSI